MASRSRNLASRFAQLKRREQILIALVAAVVPYVLIDTFLISPALVQQKKLNTEIAQKQEESLKLTVQLTSLRTQLAQDPEALNRKRLVELQGRLAELQVKVKEQSAQIVPAEKMPQVLERMLARHPRLELRELRTLAQSTVETEDKAAAKPATTAPATVETERRIYKHGVQIALRGTYLELLDYLKSLESLPGRLYWESLELAVEEYPAATLKITVYTISFDKAWMTV